MANVGYQHEQAHHQRLLAYHEPVADEQDDQPAAVVRRTATRSYCFDSISWSHLCLGIVELAGAANRADRGIDRWTGRWC